MRRFNCDYTLLHAFIVKLFTSHYLVGIEKKHAES